MSQFKSIGVFCGASPGSEPIYMESAAIMGKTLAAQNLRLVYGGGSVGLMGSLARATEESGGDILSVIPKSLVVKEITGESIGTLVLCDTMLERKEIMAEESDGFITMPGGYGTLDELFEMLTWTQLGIQRKPLGLLNINGYFNPLLVMVDSMVAAGFVRATHRELLIAESDPNALLDRMAKQELPKSIIEWQKN